MIRISVKADIALATRRLDDVQRNQVPFATALALTRTAKAAGTKLQAELRRVFDQPKPTTVRSTFIQPATKAKLQSVVGIKDLKPAGGVAPSVYLKEHFSGGSRGAKPMERALQAARVVPRGWRVVPAVGMPTDRFGNPKRERVREVIGALKAGVQVFSGRGKRQALVGYFVVQPGGRDPRAAHLHPGIYRRIKRGKDSAVVPVFLFVQAASYGQRIDLPQLVQGVVRSQFASEFASAMRTAARSVR
jgi:hypothetical protein